MKTALTLVFVTLGTICVSVTSRAVAQQPALPASPTMGSMQHQLPAAPQTAAPSGSPQPAGVPMASPAGSASVDTSMLIDNGLWDNAAMPDSCAICGGGCCAPPDWYMEQEIRLLARSRPRDVGIGFVAESTQAAANTLANEVLNSRTASPNISAAWGMTFGHWFARDTLNRDHFIEFSFWGLNNWRDEASYNGHRLSILNGAGHRINEIGDIFSGYSTTAVLSNTNEQLFILNGTYMPGFDKADRQSTYYLSSTNNFEINGRISPRNQEDRLVLHPNGKWRRECQPGMYTSYLYGLRFLQINESFRLHSESRVNTYDPNTGALLDSREDTGDYGIATHNNILGLQVGADITWRSCRWDWGLRARVGPSINFADQVSDITSVSTDPTMDPYARRLAYSKHVAALIGEIGINGSYKFRPNLVGHASYDMTWVPGVALAPEQLQFNTQPVNKINTNGLAYFHGITLSLEWLW